MLIQPLSVLSAGPVPVRQHGNCGMKLEQLGHEQRPSSPCSCEATGILSLHTWVSIYFDGKKHASNGKKVSFKEP